MGLVRMLGSLIVVGALAGSGYAAWELYDARRLESELEALRDEVEALRDRQAGIRAATVSTGDLGSLSELVRRLDGDLAQVSGELGRLDTTEDVVADLRGRLDDLTEVAQRLSDCLDRGLVVDDDTGRARCVD